MKFTYHYTKLDYPIFTTIRQNKGWYKVGQQILINTPKAEFKAEIAAIRLIKKNNITFTMAQRDADCSANELIEKLEAWYGKTYNDFILITFMKIG
jgi:hypothetical protein